MSPEDRRKYLPAEAYRFLFLTLLADRGDRGATKGELAWQTRANHYMATRVLRELQGEDLLEIEGDAKKGFTIRITQEGGRFLDQNREYWVRTFRSRLQDHFRIGKRPRWLNIPSGER